MDHVCGAGPVHSQPLAKTSWTIQGHIQSAWQQPQPQYNMPRSVNQLQETARTVTVLYHVDIWHFGSDGVVEGGTWDWLCPATLLPTFNHQLTAVRGSIGWGIQQGTSQLQLQGKGQNLNVLGVAQGAWKALRKHSERSTRFVCDLWASLTL